MTQPAPPVARMTLWSTLTRLVGDVFYLPRFHKLFLALALLAAGAGYFYEFNNPAAPATPTPQSPAVNSPAPLIPPANNLLASLSPHAKRIGLSILLGFLIGWLFRVFTKIMATMAVLFFATLALFSYFHVADDQLKSAATRDYQEATSWLSAHAAQFKDEYLQHVPSAAAGFVGIFIGARKRR